jgi:hypothetical protein
VHIEWLTPSRAPRSFSKPIQMNAISVELPAVPDKFYPCWDQSTQRDSWQVFLVRLRSSAHFASEPATRPGTGWILAQERLTSGRSPSFMNISQLRPFRRIIEEICTEPARSIDGLMEPNLPLPTSRGDIVFAPFSRAVAHLQAHAARNSRSMTTYRQGRRRCQPNKQGVQLRRDRA